MYILCCRTTAEVPLSVWYMTFYCNPNIKYAVLNKIVLQGLNACAVSYGDYVESYLYSEQVYEGEASPQIDLVNPDKDHGKSFYNVSSPLSVLLYQLLYILMVPLIAFREIFIALKASMTRDFL